jgi:hypothetical protein
VVSWSARPTLGKFFRQYFQYARGDGHAGLWPGRHAIRYAAYVTGSVLIAVAVAGGRTRAEWALAVGAIGAMAYAQKFVRRLWRRWPAEGRWARLGALALIPVILATGDVAKMLGYPLGRGERGERRRVGGAQQHARRGIPQPAP